MITDRAFLRAERDYLTPPDACDDVHHCEYCGALGEPLDPATARAAEALRLDEGALLCATCAATGDADAETAAVDAAVVALSLLSVSWRRRGTGIPTRRHFREVDTARAECATGTATRAQGWVAL